MKKFEYKIETADHSVDEVEMLNRLGLEGWELISRSYSYLSTINEPKYSYCFKREIEDSYCCLVNTTGSDKDIIEVQE